MIDVVLNYYVAIQLIVFGIDYYFSAVEVNFVRSVCAYIVNY